MEASVSRKIRVWISFETLSKRALEGVFVFLDKYEATGCGNNQTATFQYPWANLDALEDLPEAIKAELAEYVPDMTPLNLYLVYPRTYVLAEDGKSLYFRNAGKLLVGSRSRAPWDGFFRANQLSDVDE